MILAQGVTFDLTINISHIIAVLAMIGAGFGFVMMIQRRLDAQSNRLTTLDHSLTQIAAETQNDIRNLSQVIVTQARHDERITAMDLRMISQGRRLDDAVRRMNVYLDIRGAINSEEGAD